MFRPPATLPRPRLELANDVIEGWFRSRFRGRGSNAGPDLLSLSGVNASIEGGRSGL